MANPADQAGEDWVLEPPEEGISPDEDVCSCLRRMGFPNPRDWASSFRHAGYQSMDDLTGAFASLDEISSELGMPSGVRQTFLRGMQSFIEGTFFLKYPMELHEDIGAAAPRQASKSWAQIATKAAVAGVVVAGVFGALWMLAVPAVGVAATAAISTADCFDGSTEITMADRSKKKIRDVRPGDQILSFNKGRYFWKKVARIVTGVSQVYAIDVRCSDGTHISCKASAGHPFFALGQGWAVVDPSSCAPEPQPARLAVGSRLCIPGGPGAEVVGIGKPMKVATFNVCIDGPGTFFVNGLLSHSGLPADT